VLSDGQAVVAMGETTQTWDIEPSIVSPLISPSNVWLRFAFFLPLLTPDCPLPLQIPYPRHSVWPDPDPLAYYLIYIDHFKGIETLSHGRKLVS
jgi:hypothetical protein